MRSISRTLSLLVAGALLPILFVVPSVTAAPDSDHCAGGIDAGDSMGVGTPLQVWAGCQGKLYHAGEGAGFPSDWEDHYKIRIEGSGIPKLDYRLCNIDVEDAYVQYEVWFYSDLFYPRQVLAGYVSPGDCTSQSPEAVEGTYKPGEWRLIVHSNDYLVPENSSLEYDLYAQPLWR